MCPPEVCGTEGNNKTIEAVGLPESLKSHVVRMAPFGSLCTSSSCILLFLRIARKRALGFSLSYIGFYVYILLTFFVIVARCTCLTTLSFDTVVPSVGATKKK